jgi:hypothetical protein
MFKQRFLQLALPGAAIWTAYGEEHQVPDLSRAQVTIPYQELKDLWKAAQPNNPPAAKPPLAATLTSARYDLELHGDQLSGFIELEAQVFSDDWTLLPLIARDLPVDKIEPAGANIVLRDGSFALLTNKAAKQQIKLHFAATLAREGDHARLQIPNSAALLNVVTLRGIPADRSLQITNATQISNEKGVATFRVAPQERLELRLMAAANAAPVPSQWQVAAQCLASFNDEILHYEAHLIARASAGSGLSLHLRLPPDARVSSVEGEDLAAWHVEEGPEGARRIALQWRTANLLHRRFDLFYELPQSLEGVWKLHAPEVEEGSSSPAFFAVAAEPGIGLESASKVEPPRWLSEKISDLPHALVTRGDTITAALLPVVEVAPAIVEEASFSTRIVGDGSLINEQSYNIRTRAALVWSVQLPEKSELLSCAADDRRIDPIDRGNGALEVPIAPRSDGKATRITLAYTARTLPFQPVSGRLKVELPQTPLLINSLEWDLAIPAEYQIAALDGNVAPTTGARAREGSTVVRLKKELCRNERPSVELFYQRPEVHK